MRASHQALTLHSPITHPPPPCSRDANVKAIGVGQTPFLLPRLVTLQGCVALGPRKGSFRRDVSLTVSLHWTRSQLTDITTYGLNRIE
jgi:hypothetical protein